MLKDELNLIVIDQDEDFYALREQWNSLLMRSAAKTIFLTWEWQYTWWQHFGSNAQLQLRLVKQGDRLVGIAPLFSEKSRARKIIPLQNLRWLGSGAVGSDYLTLIAEPGYEEAVCELIYQDIANHSKEWDLLWLTDLPEESSAYFDLLSHFVKDDQFTCYAINERFCPYIDLRDQSWESYLDTLSANMRSNLRRRNRQVFNNLNAQVVRCEQASDITPFLDDLFALHWCRWKDHGGSDGFSGLKMRAFHQALAERLFDQGWLYLYLLKKDQQSIAAVYGLQMDNTFSFYQSGFAPEWEQYSVGMVLIGETIKDAISRGVASYDFLHGMEDYKFKWAQSLHRTDSLMIFPKHRLAPKIYFLLKILKHRLSPQYAQIA